MTQHTKAEMGVKTAPAITTNKVGDVNALQFVRSDDVALLAAGVNKLQQEAQAKCPDLAPQIQQLAGMCGSIPTHTYDQWSSGGYDGELQAFNRLAMDFGISPGDSGRR